jgi:hypothetical protein
MKEITIDASPPIGIFSLPKKGLRLFTVDKEI